MAFSLVNGLLNKAWPAPQIRVADIASEQLEKFRALNVQTFTDNSAAIDGATAVVLAVKPQIAAMVCEAMPLQPAQLLVSIAAGINCQSLSVWTAEAQPVVRCMPNTPALLGQGATALYATQYCTQAQKSLAQSILDAAGTTQWVDEESKLDAVTAVSGSGPAYFFALMEAMIDAGCELESYAADVTRTFPASGRFNKAQREIYQIVLEANQAAIDACIQGADFNAPHTAAIQAMVEGLLALGLLQGSVEQVLENEDYKQYCPHRTSHWLGLDVHDVGDYRIDESWRELEPGMVLTVEPGIYIPLDSQASDAPKKYRGIGVRIEDDVLVTKTGPEVLSNSMPKEVADVEALVGTAVQTSTQAKARAV